MASSVPSSITHDWGPDAGQTILLEMFSPHHTRWHPCELTERLNCYWTCSEEAQYRTVTGRLANMRTFSAQRLSAWLVASTDRMRRQSTWFSNRWDLRIPLTNASKRHPKTTGGWSPHLPPRCKASRFCDWRGAAKRKVSTLLVLYDSDEMASTSVLLSEPCMKKCFLPTLATPSGFHTMLQNRHHFEDSVLGIAIRGLSFQDLLHGSWPVVPLGVPRLYP